MAGITRRFSILAPLALSACAAIETRLEPVQGKLHAWDSAANAKLDEWKTTLFQGRAKDAVGRWAELEKKAGGRLGVAVLGGGRVFTHYRGDERFALCSTFKLALAALVLREGQAGRLNLREIVSYSEADLLEYGPDTRANLATGMSIQDLAKAAQITSDNTATNLLLARIGGPEGFTQLLRAIGDDGTRLDRMEPEMNRVHAGEAQDTTTPIAFAHTALKLTTGDVLIPAHRDLLIGWMRETQTGANRLRGVLPAGWNAGDKTGSGFGNGIPNKTNDVAVAFPLRLGPVALAAYYEAPVATQDVRPDDEAVLAEAGRIAVKALDG